MFGIESRAQDATSTTENSTAPATGRPFLRPGGGPLGRRPSQAGTQTHQIWSATSADGLSWTKDSALLFDRASVPDAVVSPNGTLLLYFADASGSPSISVATSHDSGASWTKSPITLDNAAPQGMADPNPVLLSDGRIRLFYLGALQASGQNAGAAAPAIQSALSWDGIRFTRESGTRFSASGATNPDAILTPTGWKLFLSRGQTLISASSRDGKTFTQDAATVSQNGAASKTVAFPTGYRLYKAGTGGILCAFSTDLVHWQDEGVCLAADAGETVGDPAVIRLANGTYKMFYKKTAAADRSFGPTGGPFRRPSQQTNSQQ